MNNHKNDISLLYYRCGSKNMNIYIVRHILCMHCRSDPSKSAVSFYGAGGVVPATNYGWFGYWCACFLLVYTPTLLTLIALNYFTNYSTTGKYRQEGHHCIFHACMCAVFRMACVKHSTAAYWLYGKHGSGIYLYIYICMFTVNWTWWKSRTLSVISVTLWAQTMNWNLASFNLAHGEAHAVQSAATGLMTH